jgi:hypothetical protein
MTSMMTESVTWLASYTCRDILIKKLVHYACEVVAMGNAIAIVDSIGLY